MIYSYLISIREFDLRKKIICICIHSIRSYPIRFHRCLKPCVTCTLMGFLQHQLFLKTNDFFHLVFSAWPNYHFRILYFNDVHKRIYKKSITINLHIMKAKQPSLMTDCIWNETLQTLVAWDWELWFATSMLHAPSIPQMVA